MVLAAALALSALVPQMAQAHPHAWIDVRVAVVFDDEGRVIGLRQAWLFDEFYTVFATTGLDQDGDGIPDPGLIDALGDENMKNLADFDYFTSIWVGEGKGAFGKATDIASRLAGDRLEMSFFVPLAEPIAVRDAKVTYAVYDPTYYVELLHAEADDAIRLENAPADCSHRLTPPNPDPEMVAFAYSLSPTQSGGDGLGILFAERISLRCSAGS